MRKLFLLTISVITIILFITPIIIFGISDLEEYQLGLFSIKILSKSFENFFLTYVDFYGPGIELPIGSSSYVNPINIFINLGIKIYYILFIFILLVIQVYFANKILKIFFQTKIKKDIFIINFTFNLLLIFSISNFNYIYNNDWFNHLFTYSIFFPGFYYFLKFLKKNRNQDLLAFFIVIIFQFINSSISILIIFYIFYLLFFIFNYQCIRKLFNNKYFYFYLIIFLSLFIDNTYNLFSELEKFPTDITRYNQGGYNFKDYLVILLHPLIIDFDLFHITYSREFTEATTRMPGYGINILLALICSFILIIRNQSKKYHYINYVLISAILLSFLNNNKYTFLFSGIWYFRDIVNIISFILIYILLVGSFLRKNLKYLIIIFLLISSSAYYLINTQIIIKNYKPNFINEEISNPILIENLNKIKEDKETFNRIYFSPDSYLLIRNKLSRYGIYAVTDFIDYNLMPFNGWFKNYSLDNLYNSEFVMHGRILPDYNLINNKIFLSTFKIKYLFYEKNEIKNINIEMFETVFEFEHDKYNLVLAKYKNINDSFVMSGKINFEFRDNIMKYLSNINFIENNQVYIKRNKVNNYSIINDSNYEVSLLFPFNNGKNWTFVNNENNEIIKKEIFLNFPIVNVPANTHLTAQYINYHKLIVRVLILMILFFMIVTKLFWKNLFIEKISIKKK
jgi:hypothetical protein